MKGSLKCCPLRALLPALGYLFLHLCIFTVRGNCSGCPEQHCPPRSKRPHLGQHHHPVLQLCAPTARNCFEVGQELWFSLRGSFPLRDYLAKAWMAMPDCHLGTVLLAS